MFVISMLDRRRLSRDILEKEFQFSVLLFFFVVLPLHLNFPWRKTGLSEALKLGLDEKHLKLFS